MSRGRFAVLVISIVSLVAVSAAGETITYDGELLDAGVPANGIFDFRFRCFSGPEADANTQIGPTVDKDDVQVVHGQFTVELEFGPNDRCLDSGWLETAVARSDRLGGFTTLEPLQAAAASTSRKSGESAPSGAVVFFNLSQCPDGWSEFVQARGRAIVGLTVSGTLGGTYGAPLGNLEQRTHQHQYSFTVDSSSSGYHNHIWASIQNVGGVIQWTSYTDGANPVLAFQWGNGIDNAGSGIFPLAAQPNDTFYTSMGGAHDHSVTVGPINTSAAASSVPYIQLLACQKD